MVLLRDDRKGRSPVGLDFFEHERRQLGQNPDVRPLKVASGRSGVERQLRARGRHFVFGPTARLRQRMTQNPDDIVPSAGNRPELSRPSGLIRNNWWQGVSDSPLACVASAPPLLETVRISQPLPSFCAADAAEFCLTQSSECSRRRAAAESVCSGSEAVPDAPGSSPVSVRCHLVEQ